MAGTSSEASKLVMLGTGTPNADPARSGPSVAIVVGDRSYLFDAGPGIVRRAAAAHAAGIDALAPRSLSLAFLTHLHSDHTVGLPDLILTPWTVGRESPLRVYGPRGLRAMCDDLRSAYAEDIRERLEGLEPANDEGHRVEVTEIQAGPVYQDDLVSIATFPANHGRWPAFGYRVSTPDRVIVLSGDTAPFQGWEEAYAGCDVLVHEVQSSVGLAERSASWRAYHEAMHTTAADLAGVASAVRPELLVLYHQLFHGVTEEELVGEVRASYDGDVVSAADLDVY